MENATKALMIAAAVLVAILIISLGIGVFNSASEQMNDMDLTEYQKQQFNEKFTKYQGKQSGAEVNALVQTVFTHNNAQESASTCVSMSGKVTLAASNTLTSMPAKLPIANTYSVKINYSNGLVLSIEVSQ